MSELFELTTEKMYERIVSAESKIGKITSAELIDTERVLFNGHIVVTFDKHNHPVEVQHIEADILTELEERANNE